ncbi:MAG: hypothetical protein F6K41_45000, partial [Symploca sp. SIO3E6]|nr:hypothetical protein [Caldora sp. SIO3E6]
MGWLPTVVSCAITAVGGFKLVRGELKLLTMILLAVGFVSLLSICFYVFFKKNSNKRKRLALIGLFAVTFLITLSSG